MTFYSVAIANTTTQQQWNQPPQITFFPRSGLRNRGTKQRYNRGLVRRLYDESLRNAFKSYSDVWIEETAPYSSITSMMRHPLFDKIVSMDRDAAKFILQEMENGQIRLHWFPVLQRIARFDPVPEYSRGILREMADAWLEWGRSQNLI